MPRLRSFLVSLAGALALAGATAAGAAAAPRIDTVTGTGVAGFSGDGGLATAAQIFQPAYVAAEGDGYLIADASNNRIRRVDPLGLITTVAGAGPANNAPGAFAGQGVLATDPSVRLNRPNGVAPLPGGGFLIADTLNQRIRRVDAAGVITTVAGTGVNDFLGDGGPATAAALSNPRAVTPLAGGGFLIADTSNQVIRRVDAGGTITTIAGRGRSAGFSGDEGPATAAQLNFPTDVALQVDGSLLIADRDNNRIRRVRTDNSITTYAGTGAAGFGGDGGVAERAVLRAPTGVTTRANGFALIADAGNERIREVDGVNATGPDNVIRTIAGTGTAGFGGDGGDPLLAALNVPNAVSVTPGRVLIGDAQNSRIRAITDPPPPGPGPDPAPTPRGQDPPRDVPPGVSPPVIGRSTVVAPAGGRTLIRLPGTRRFVRLRAITNIPLGAELDTRRGRATVQFRTTSAGRLASVVVSEGRVIVRQFDVLDGGQRPGTLVLSGPLQGCRAFARRGRRGAGRRARGGAPTRPRAAAAARKQRGRKGRRARVHADGRIEVRGRYGAAIVRGTRWTTVDRCSADPRPGTFFAVTEGRVSVTAFVLRRSRIVRSGQRYLAPAGRAR